MCGKLDLPLELILLLDGVRVRRTLSGVDQLLGQALSNALDVSERSFPCADGQKGNSLVDSPQGRDIDGLSPNCTSRSDTGGVLPGSAVLNGVNGNLDGVLVGHQVDDGEGVIDDADSHQLLSVVAAIHHQGVGETLNDRTLSLAEPLGGITTGGVRKVDRGPDLHIIAVEPNPSAQLHLRLDSLPTKLFHAAITIVPYSFPSSKVESERVILRQRDIFDLNIVVAPLIEQLDAANLVGDLLGEHWEGGSGDLDFSAIRHIGVRLWGVLGRERVFRKVSEVVC